MQDGRREERSPLLPAARRPSPRQRRSVRGLLAHRIWRAYRARPASRLVEIVEWIATAAEFEPPAEKAAIELAAVGILTVREGNTGDNAVNDWIAAMLGIYRTLTGKEPATSVGASDRANEGIAAGPLIRFLQAAGKPLNIEFSNREGADHDRRAGHGQ